MKGIVFHKHTNTRIKNAGICNTRSLERTSSNAMGSFDIRIQEGDTLQITCEGYLKQEFWITKTENLVLYLEPAVPSLVPQAPQKKGSFFYFFTFLSKSVQKIKGSVIQRKK
ncbi:hypothetical protein B0O44_108144 [Pedobacter nutrimenti]|uniref:Carboxypeptidase-like protein n=2 Tax=Pedobacter nutrimenti TaxID=1241337 RepID=A0A318UBP8_9SPHI|nr:hypothetical protein B0O44_108144 [Pedobacter nutrimenti]